MVIAHFNLHAEHNWSQTGAPPAGACIGGSVEMSPGPRRRVIDFAGETCNMGL